MAAKYLRINPTNAAEEEFQAPDNGAAAVAGDIPALGSDKRLSTDFMPVGITADTETMPAFENLAAGDFINVFLDAGVAKARKADAASFAKRCLGFVLSAATAGSNVLVYFEGRNTQLTSLTIGALYFLSNATPGAVTTTAITTSGHILQPVGTAVSATTLSFEAQRPIIRA